MEDRSVPVLSANGKQLDPRSVLLFGFANILDPYGQRVDAAERTGSLAVFGNPAVAIGPLRRVVRAA